jgi:hypothetical protein
MAMDDGLRLPKVTKICIFKCFMGEKIMGFNSQPLEFSSIYLIYPSRRSVKIISEVIADFQG